MSHKVWIQRLSFNLGNTIRWRMAVILTLGLLSVAGIREPGAVANSQFASAQTKEQSFMTAQSEFEEGRMLLEQGTPESSRLALKKFEEVLSIIRGTPISTERNSATFPGKVS